MQGTSGNTSCTLLAHQCFSAVTELVMMHVYQIIWPVYNWSCSKCTIIVGQWTLLVKMTEIIGSAEIWASCFINVNATGVSRCYTRRNPPWSTVLRILVFSSAPTPEGKKRLLVVATCICLLGLLQDITDWIVYTTEMYCLILWKLEICNPGVGRVAFFWGPQGKGLPHAPLLGSPVAFILTLCRSLCPHVPFL